MGLYTFLYENLLYRLYTTGIQPPLLVPARLSRYTAHTAHTAIQPYTPYIIQRYTASLCQPAQRPHPRPPGSFLITDHKAPGYYAMCYASTLNHKSGTEFR